MTQEEKELLLKDLNARLPYGVYVEHTTTKIRGKLKDIVFEHIYNGTDSIQDINAWVMFFGDEYVDATYFRPFLRPMSSMTEEEKKEYIECAGYEIEESVNGRHYEYYLKDFCGTTDNPSVNADGVDWLVAHHFDIRNLIEKGLALEAPKGMYK